MLFRYWPSSSSVVDDTHFQMTGPYSRSQIDIRQPAAALIDPFRNPFPRIYVHTEQAERCADACNVKPGV